MNGEILNLSAIHNGGKPELNVGIRENSFTIKLSEDKTSLQFIDMNGNKLKLDGITNAYTKTEVDSKNTTIQNSIPKVTVSTTPPTSSSSGKTGDIWIVYEQ